MSASKMSIPIDDCAFRVAGGIDFFTVNLLERGNTLLLELPVLVALAEESLAAAVVP